MASTKPKPADNQEDKIERKRQEWQDKYLDAVDLSNAHEKQLEEAQDTTDSDSTDDTAGE